MNRITACLLSVSLVGASMGAALAADWPQWLGPNLNGISADVPQRLPAKATLVWKVPLATEGHAGIAATEKYVVMPDFADGKDVIRCFDAVTGAALWTASYDSVPEGEDLDYGNAPRATACIAGDRVVTLGATGELRCFNLTDGKVLWQKSFANDFGADRPEWGYCASPILADGKIIVMPGGGKVGLLALDPKTGKTLWTGPCDGPAYGTLSLATLGGVKQLVGHDGGGIGGWDVNTGKRLWAVAPPNGGDYNIGSPMFVDGKLIMASDNNVTRLYEFEDGGKVKAEPVAISEDYAPDMATPVVCNGLLFGTTMGGGLVCLDTKDGLKTLWRNDQDNDLCSFSTMIAGNDRVMIFTAEGKLILVAANPDKCEIVGKLNKLTKGGWGVPALVGSRLYMHDAETLYCYSLE